MSRPSGIGDPPSLVRHHRPTTGRHASRRYTPVVPAERIAENLAFINWTVLTGLAIGLVRGGRPRSRCGPTRPAASSPSRLHARSALGVLAFLSDLGRRRRWLGGSPSLPMPHSTCRDAWPSRRSCCSPARWSSRSPAAGARAGWGRRGDRGRRDAAARCGAVGRRRPLGRPAPAPARRPRRRDRRRLRGDDPGPLVPGDAEAARGAAGAVRPDPHGARRPAAPARARVARDRAPVRAAAARGRSPPSSAVGTLRLAAARRRAGVPAGPERGRRCRRRAAGRWSPRPGCCTSTSGRSRRARSWLPACTSRGGLLV